MATAAPPKRRSKPQPRKTPPWVLITRKPTRGKRHFLADREKIPVTLDLTTDPAKAVHYKDRTGPSKFFMRNPGLRKVLRHVRLDKIALPK